MGPFGHYTPGLNRRKGVAEVERLSELRCKEVINIRDGSRYGYVGDMELEMDSGHVRSLVIPGRLRLLGLLGREPDRVIPWEAVRRFGEDVILVEDAPVLLGRRRRQWESPREEEKEGAQG